LPATLLFFAARSYLQALERPRALVFSMILANVLNLVLSWTLVFGDAGLVRLGLPPLGVPAFGVTGAGWTSAGCECLQLCVLSLAVRRISVSGAWSRKPDMRALKQLASLGLPIGLTMLSEVGVFGLVSILMGKLGSLQLAAHQVALTLVSTAFMIPLGLGAATSVRVGHAVGRSDLVAARLAGFVGVGIGLTVMVMTALTFALFPLPLAALVSDQEQVLAAALPLLAVGAVFQLSDGTQAVTAGALRGAGDTRWPLLANLVGHSLLGLPVGVWLAFEDGWSGVGLWWGLSLGLSIVAVTLVTRFHVLTRAPRPPEGGATSPPRRPESAAHSGRHGLT
jgi:multidrug resistance protein, MATE family